MAAKIFRINYKSDFILTMNSDAGWAIPFCIKFFTSVPSRAYFVGFDGTTYTHCAYDPSEPTKLVVQFDDHHLPIGDLNYQIAYHFTVADFPNDTEDEVINPAAITTEIDGETYHVMLDFTGETAPEIEFNLPAYAAEAERIQNELQRQQNEAARIEAELEREQASAAAVQGAENVNAQLSGNILTVTNRNGVSTSVNTKGEQGKQGPVGPEGPQGETGISIVSFLPKSETATTLIYTITYSNGYTQDVAIPKGPKGDTGATGPTGPQGLQGQTGVSITGMVNTGETETDTLYNITFSNGTTQQVAIPKGEKGDQGPVGPQGPQGPMGDVAVITPEQQAAFTMYSTPGQNTDGPMTQKAVTDALTSTNDLEVSLSVGSCYNVAIVQGVWKSNTSSMLQACNIIPVKEGEEYHVVARTSSADQGSYAWLTSDSYVAGQAPAFLSGYENVITFAANTEFNIIVPDGAKYLYFGRIVQGIGRLPKEVRLLHRTKNMTEGNTSYLIGEMKILSVGQAYEIGDAVRTADMKLLRMTKQVKEASNKDTISVGELKSWSGQSKTLVGLQAVEPYDSTHTYSSGDYALGSPNGDTVICKYSNDSWASALYADMVSDGILEEVSIDYIIENATEKNDVVHDIKNRAGWVSEELFDINDPLQMPYVYNSSFMSATKTETGVVWTVTEKKNWANNVYLALPNMHYGSRIVISFDYKNEFAAAAIAKADMLPLINNSTGSYPTPGKVIGNIRPECNHADFEFVYDNENTKYLLFNFEGGFATNVGRVLELSNISIKEYRLVKDETLKDSEAVIYEVGDELGLTHYLARYGLLRSTNTWGIDADKNSRHIIIPVGNASVFTVTGGINNGSYAFLADYRFESDKQALFAKGETRRTVSAEETQRVSVPAGAKWLMVNIASTAGNDLKPTSIVVSNIDGNYAPYKESRLNCIEENTAATKAILGDYKALDGDMNLQIVKAGRESAASCYWWYPFIIGTRFPYKRIYHAFCDGKGSAGVACVNAFDKRAWKVILKRMLYDGNVDLHNCMSVFRVPSGDDEGKLVCAYSEGHNQTTYLHIRISKNPDDITEWEDAISVNAGSLITYSQFHYVNGKYYIFSRMNFGASWGYTCSNDLRNWSDYHTLITQRDTGNAKYFYIWLKPISDEPNMLRFISYGHPIYQDTGIRCGVIDFENDLIYNYADMSQPLGSLSGNYSNGDFTQLIEHPNENVYGRQRMFDLAVTNLDELRILYGRQKLGTQTDGNYFVYEASYSDIAAASDKTQAGTRTTLCQSGLVFLDHDNTHAQNGVCFLDKDTVFVSRSSQDYIGYDYMEIYKKTEGEWGFEKEVYKELKGEELLRNAYPIASPDGKYVVWMRGYVALDSFNNAKVDLILYDVDNDDVF